MEEAGYVLYRSEYVVEHQAEMIAELDRAHKRFESTFEQVDSTSGYAFYNVFALTAPSVHFYNLYQELRNLIRKHYPDPEQMLWLQAWFNYHQPEEVLKRHDHDWPWHGYISIDPKKTKTVFDNYEVVNEVGMIYMGPGHRFHEVVNLEPFDGRRITLAFDVETEPDPTHNFSLFPLL